MCESIHSCSCARKKKKQGIFKKYPVSVLPVCGDARGNSNESTKCIERVRFLHFTPDLTHLYLSQRIETMYDKLVVVTDPPAMCEMRNCERDVTMVEEECDPETKKMSNKEVVAH